MTDLVEAEFLDGITDIVTVAEANYYKAHNMLAPSPKVNSLTLEDVYGEDYADRYKGS